jgi:Domain of unknown function (DUF222)/HNH endonuclease
MYRPTETPLERAPASPAELETEHLEHELCELSSHLTAAMARWIALVDEYDRREGWGRWGGVVSTAHWISWQCACSVRTARDHVRVARALRSLPLIREAFATGSLSYSKVRALTRVATPESEEFLHHLATYATASQLDHMLSAYRESERPDPERHGERGLRWHWNRDGTLTVSARLDADEGRSLLDALEAGRSRIREEDRASGEENGSAEPLEPLAEQRASNADALSLIAESFLAGGAKERAGPTRQQLIVHVDAGTLADDEPGCSKLHNGPRVAPELARRLGCDATLQVLIERGKKALYLGRKTRSIPPALNLALRERDRGCRFPGCTNRRFTDAHHVVHWSRGGTTDPENLVLLCRRHHRLIHEGGFSVTGNANEELVFRDPSGERLENSPQPPPGSLPALVERNRASGLALAHETLLKGDGERMDLVENVYAVAKAIHGPERDIIHP